MNFFRIVFYCRRRRKHRFFLFILLILIISSYICYWWIEIYSPDHPIDIFENELKETENDELGKNHPIFAKYIQHPYNIDVWNIINEANRKYEEKNPKYLVYSCRFMCGGKEKTFLFYNEKINEN